MGHCEWLQSKSTPQTENGGHVCLRHLLGKLRHSLNSASLRHKPSSALPIRGTESDVAGMISATSSMKTVRESNTVIPERETHSSLSGKKKKTRQSASGTCPEFTVPVHMGLGDSLGTVSSISPKVLSGGDTGARTLQESIQNG